MTRPCAYCRTPLVRKTYHNGRVEPLDQFQARATCNNQCTMRLKEQARNTCVCGLEPAVRRVERPRGSGHIVALGRNCLALHREQVAIRHTLDTPHRVVDLGGSYGGVRMSGRKGGL